jgi:hypothetical protein
MHDSPTPNLCSSVNPKEPQHSQFAYGLLVLELVTLHLPTLLGSFASIPFYHTQTPPAPQPFRTCIKYRRHACVGLSHAV